jgi:hypothetical protein
MSRRSVPVRGVVQVADHRNPVHAVGQQATIDLGDPDRLPPADRVGRDLPAVPLALEVIDQDRDPVPRRCAEVVFGAVPAEDPPGAVGVVDVGALPDQRIAGRGEHAHVDAPLVVAVDHHDVRVARSAAVDDAGVGEPLERQPALRLDDPHDVGVHVPQHPRGVHQSQFVDAVGGQLHPADPIGPAAGHHVHPPVPGPPQQPPPVLPQPGELRGVGVAQPEPDELAQDVVLDLVGVERLLQQRTDPLKALQHRPPEGPGALVEGASPVEQILHIERGDPHEIDNSESSSAAVTAR